MERKFNISTILNSYLACALWTNELDSNSVEDFDEETKKEAVTIIHRFLKAALPLLTDEWTDEQIGHDLWLTRGGHGAGFWDRGLPNGDMLTDLCKTMEFHGEVFEADGVVYINDTAV